MSKQPKKQVLVRLYRFRNKLRDKAGGAAGTGGGSFARDALAKAEAEFQKMAEDYPDWVGKYITQLQQHLAGAREKDVEPHRAPHIARINQLAHELKGQGGTFGYPLITAFGRSLHEATVPGMGTTDNYLEIIKAHIDAMQAVIKGRVSGDGGKVGAELMKSLEQAKQKYSRGEQVIE